MRKAEVANHPSRRFYASIRGAPGPRPGFPFSRLEVRSNGKRVGRVFYREFSNRLLAGTTLTESGQEYIANVVEVPNLATILSADLIPAVVVREQEATGMPLRHRT